MAEPQSVITQVSADQGLPPVMQDQGQEFLDDDSLIHLNIQENHYYITRDQLMSLPESLLLCLFPSGVFMDRTGQVITNLTSQDEVYVGNFPPDCFEYIMESYVRAQEDLINFPVDEIFNRAQSSREPSRFFGFASPSAMAPSSSNSEAEILHEKPSIIVLREDLDYYCVPFQSLAFPEGASEELKSELTDNFIAQVKLAAGSYLSAQTSVFEGLFSSNRLKRPQKTASGETVSKLGPAEQHLMDMLCTSGFHDSSVWGNRAQEPGKTVISSLSLCRLLNETTQEFRDKADSARRSYEEKVESSRALSESPSLTPLMSRTSQGSTAAEVKRKSRLSSLADNVRSRSASRNRSSSRQNRDHTPTLYDLVPKPDINSKLLLFWKKPARKCWWGEEDLKLTLKLYGEIDSETGKLLLLPQGPIVTLEVSVKLHIRRVWTLELSVVGVE
ncbi:LANO_0H23156g1_1 [Lachancea nothofagi CBS 11611]|uniref:LANO_0H23156g1_1 n=1 Tax=Lachancea nothofagi CBS 11611 TaxID=1266666 RepID=A0A1G4KNL2_9SACH|nr:LANO_0H23156g1_1 [Lachancea nothofagi CBS 11611]